MAIILPHGVLFRAGGGTHPHQAAEGRHIDTVIGLPANLFYSTGIPVCILVLKKCKSRTTCCSSTRPEHFEKASARTSSPTSTSPRSSTPTSSGGKARYARRVAMAEIEKNDFNLNISRYRSSCASTPRLAPSNACRFGRLCARREAFLRTEGGRLRCRVVAVLGADLVLDALDALVAFVLGEGRRVVAERRA